jgi:hypothetical protein
MELSRPAVVRFFAMMAERDAIRQRKESGVPWPWTDDPILRAYKFTNVRRSDDKTTRALVEEFYGKHPIHAESGGPDWLRQARAALLNCAIARYFGTIEFMRVVGWQARFDPARLKRLARQRLDAGERVYTGAYMISPCGHDGPKEQVIVGFLADLWRQSEEVCQAALNASWQQFVERLSQVEGFGGTSFMAKEVSLDTRLVPGFWPRQPDDRYTWTPVGPGSKRGAGRMLGDDAGRAVSNAMMLEVCRELFARRNDYLPGDFVALELHDVQFQLCEWSKYEKVRLGQGRPRSIYRRPA